MDKLKQYIALTLVGMLAVLAGGWFLLVSPKRSEAADLRSTAAGTESSNQALRVSLAQLKAANKDVPKEQAKIAAVAAKIPDNPALPALVRALSAAADDAGVELVSIAPGQPTVVAAAAPAVAKPVASAATDEASTASKGAVPKGVVRAGATPGAAAGTAGSLQSILLNLNVVGGYFQVEQFLDRVENLTRAFKVNGFTLSPGANPVKPAASQASVENGSSLTAVITGQVFLALGRPTLGTSPTTAK